MRGEERDGWSGGAGCADPSICDFMPFLFLHAHPLTDSLATAALVCLEMLRRGGGKEDVGNSSISLISRLSNESQPHPALLFTQPREG